MNFSKYIPKQVQVPYLGALFDLVSKALAIAGAFNFIALTRNWFYDENDTILRDIFSSYVIFMIVVSLAGFVLLLVIYIVFVPSINSHIQEQAVKDGRSPTFEKICENSIKLQNLEEKICKIDNLLKDIEKRL